MKITCQNAYRPFAPHGNHFAGCLGFLVILPLLQCFCLALPGFSISIAIVILLPIFFIVSDIWVFGGSCSRQTGWSEYLKTSARGIEILRTALIQNCISRLGITALVMLLSTAEEWYFLAYRGDYEMLIGDLLLQTLQRILVIYASSMLCSLISRHFDQLIWYFAFGSLAANVSVLICMRANRRTTLILSILLGSLCSVLFSVLAVKRTINKTRRSYYDKTVEI